MGETETQRKRERVRHQESLGCASHAVGARAPGAADAPGAPRTVSKPIHPNLGSGLSGL